MIELMVLAREDAINLARDFRQKLSSLYGDRLRGTYLFGSYARDDASEDSDVDVAVVLAGEIGRKEERHRVIDMLSAFCLQHHCLIIPFFLSEQEFQAAPYAIHRSIVREGIAL